MAQQAERPRSDILIVDDNPANIVAVEAALGDLEVSISRAHSGSDALRVLLERDVALILLDVKMPTMDGLETARLIRERKRTRYTPIIFMTAYGRNDEEILAAYQLGAVDFLFKPIVAEVLRAKAGVFVELERRAAELTRQAELIREHERREHERALEAGRRSWEQEAMKQRVAELAEADRRKDEFLAILGHELRNPLAPIVSGLDLMRAKFLSPDADPALQRIHERMQRQVQHLTRLVDDLLDVSRITRGKIDLTIEPVDVAQVVAAAIETSRPNIDGARHTLSLQLPPQTLHVSGDFARVSQILANVVNNAAKYTPKGGLISLSATREGDMVVFRVRDSGVGIPAEFIGSIFEPFTQVDRTLARSHGGLGIGLTLVRKLVEMQNGTVSARSEGRRHGDPPGFRWCGGAGQCGDGIVRALRARA